MGAALYASEPVVRAVLDRCDEALREERGASLLDVMFARPGAMGDLDDPRWKQPAIYALECALAALWSSLGVQPEVVLGHSLGEIAAAHSAGVFGLEDGLRIAALRGGLIGALPGEGAMAAVFAPASRVSKALDEHNSASQGVALSIAADNGAHQVISGPAAEVTAVLEQLEERPVPAPGAGEVLVRVAACGVCRTDLHVVDGDLAEPRLPVVPGHEVVGRVAAVGPDVDRFREGERVGIPWLGWTCGACRYCRSGRENLCPHALFTGYTRDGGYGDYCVADARYCLPLGGERSDVEAAPLLCAGLIGYRALIMAGDAERLGLYGFGAAAHIIAQVARAQARRVFAFVRPGDRAAADFALGLGAAWAGPSDEAPPEELDAALLFAPVGALVPAALRAIAPGGTVVCAGIHMSDIPAFPYELLWRERRIVSVANLTRRDGEEFLALAARTEIAMHAEPMPLADANTALDRLRSGRLQGAAVLTMDESA